MKSERVVVISGSSKGETRSLLPALRFLPDDDLIQLKYGTVLQVFEVEGANLYDFIEKGENWTKSFKHLIDELKCDLQLIVTSRPFPIGSPDNYFATVGKSEDAYCQWYSDYTFRWFRRVSECTYLPSLRFFLVLSIPSLAKGQSKNTSLVKRRFAAAVEQTLEILIRAGHQPRVLKRTEFRNSLMQSFILPASDSEADLIQSFPEALTSSTLTEPRFNGGNNGLLIGELFHSAGNFSHLSSAPLRWLIGLLSIMVPYTVSIHIKRCSQADARRMISKKRFDRAEFPELQNVLVGKSKAVDVSISFSTYGKTENESFSNLKTLRRFFSEKGATPVSGRNQLEIWQSTLPLGLSADLPVHRISSEIATTCWPYPKVVPIQKVGLPLGVAWASLEPYFLDPDSTNHTLLVGSKSSEISSLSTFIASRHLSVGVEVLYLGNSHSARFLAQLFGELSVVQSVEKPLKSADKVLSVIAFDSAKVKDGIAPDKLASLHSSVTSWLKSKRQMLVIEDCTAFLKTDPGMSTLRRILSASRRAGTPVYIGVQARDLQLRPSFFRQFENQLIFPLAKRNRASALQVLRVSDKVHMDGCDSSLLLAVTGKNRSVIRWQLSPMDVAMLLRSQLVKNQNARTEKAYRNQREELKAECIAKNPGLSECDAWRQAIYYFGLKYKG